MTRSTPESSQREAAQLVASIPNWHHRFEVAPGVVTPGTYDPSFLLEKLQLPDDLAGRRALDIGTADGYFALNLRRRGAEVVAVDYRPKSMNGFAIMERLSGFDFDYRQANVYAIDREIPGTFEIVTFLGVLYHLPDMLKALHNIRKLCSGQLFLETICSVDDSEAAAARYHRASTLNGDISNFWSPNPACVRDMLYDAGFDIERDETWGPGAFDRGQARAPHDRYFAAARISDDPDRTYKLKVAYSMPEA